MPDWLFTSIVLAGLGLALAWLIWRFLAIPRQRREARLRTVLDHADQLQALLAVASRRMAEWHARVGRLAGDLGSGAQRALDAEPLIQEARRDLLQHRLWLQEKGLNATRRELDDAILALARVRVRLEAELQALDSAGDALTQATDAAQTAARREPPSLRRG
ncbi:hypothetical protein [Silanimonas sp.]|uniref:hypothetical protein n=1 Tax=Silanimonas sp. TaxID=1929290 RepID=UPI001BC7504D|nr:hypothetical protein [Silanimonas sp.]MBS3895588.1 hypothetical protein [Silanimonas sp.]MBS3924329.1 hypothetical protein [Xanthomonadaceae bacterium]